MEQKIKILRPDQAADRLNVSKRTVYRLIQAGHFVCLKVGGSVRITEPSVEQFIRKQIEAHYIEHGLNFSDKRPNV